MRRTYAVLAAAAVAVATAVTTAPTPAYADHEGTPTVRQLLELCNVSTDLCEFHPGGEPELFSAHGRVVGSEVFNCTSGRQNMAVQWADTTSQSNSVGLALTTEAGFGEVFSVSYEQSFQHTWTTSHTEAQTTFVNTGPGEVGWVERRPRMQRVHGTYELHFGSRQWGHYIWYAPFTAEGPVPGSPDEIVTQNVRPMTDAEEAACP
ncbi:hypothetical protein GCM10007079_39030 [Nocardiopsis terrae]|uniref:Allene oxide cyclase barrel-like domain-containing protein n=1 Tax=Nocardiopsis terrae TaxID=372655 RepID=A0ABR9HER9_9ACTN|nr:hypothetical protein [Nocardiopsis terrae]MBE1457290.1 hypothetical protein [Nocardiopsis terrae]GHC91579.1 hypothetical protein GCM10007079_39030 [Nocardiopsis terrae]